MDPKYGLIEFLTHPTVVVAVFLGASALLLGYILRLFRNVDRDGKIKSEQLPALAEKKPFSKPHKKKPSSDTAATNKWSNRGENSPPWLLSTLKGHTGPVLNIDYSPNGKFLASCGEDRAVLLWDAKDLTQKEHRHVRVNVDFDHPTFVKWSPDSRAFIIHKYNENAIEVYKVEKKKDSFLGHATKALTYPKAHDADVIGMGIARASNGNFIMTCSNGTDLVVWDLKGQVLGRIDTYLMSTTCAKVSPCGKFIAASGFAPDAKVWEVMFSKTGEFQEIKRVFELTGHSSGVYDVAFDADSSHMATVSKDGTWKLFDTKIEYKKGEDPHLKITGKYQQAGGHALIALSPNAEVVVIAAANNLAFYSTLSGRLDRTIENIFSGNISCLLFDALGKYLLVGGDKQIRVFHNVTGYRCDIETAREKLKQQQTSATRERLEKLIEDSQAFLNTIDNKK